MGSDSQSEADQSQECCNWVDDEDRGQAMSRIGRQGEGVIVGIAATREEAVYIIITAQVSIGSEGVERRMGECAPVL